MITRELHRRWLRVTALIVGGFGPVFFLGTLPETSALPRLGLDLLAWPIDGAQSYDSATTRFLSALTGGFLLGWGVLIWALSGRAFDSAPDAIRRAVLAGLIAWFCLDSMGSVASGQPANVAFNVIVLLLAAGPLWFRAQDTH